MSQSWRNMENDTFRESYDCGRLFPPSLSGSNDVIQWANSNKAEEHPDVQCQARGRSHPMAATTAVLNHPIKHPSICASQGDGLTKLA